MSRSNPASEAVNPAKRRFQWSGSTGKVKYYDRETKENVELDLPFKFMVLDQLSTVTGFDDKTKSGFWANEVKKTEDTLTVRNKGGVVARGSYKEVSDVLGKDLKYTRSVYIAYKDEAGALQIGNIQFAGSSIGPWFDFTRANDVNKVAISIVSTIDGRKGSVDYLIPVFVATEVSESANAAALELDVELQDYLNTYFANYSDRSTQVDARDYTDEEAPADEDQAEAMSEEDFESLPTNNATVEDDGKLKISDIEF